LDNYLFLKNKFVTRSARWRIHNGQGGLIDAGYEHLHSC
jgi:hypothetical protein